MPRRLSYITFEIYALAARSYDAPQQGKDLIAAKSLEKRMSRLGGLRLGGLRLGGSRLGGSRLGGLIGLLAAAGAVFWSLPGRAQEHYPSRTVKIVIPSAPGSTTDTLARIVADQLSQKWGKPTIVENIPGGAMNIGASNVARSAPDGYTLLIAPPSPLSFNHLLYREPGYDPARFVPITMLAKIPNVLVVRNELPATTLKDLISYGKANPGKLSYASQGVGSTAHLSAAQLEVRTAITMVHVPYRGAQPALTDVVAGHVDMFFDTLATSVPLYRDNKVKLLGVADVKRAGIVPELPTISEAGLPGFRSITWFGLVAPPATPAALAEKINRDVVEILNSNDVGNMLHRISLEPGATSPAETARFFAEEAALWNKVIKEAGIEPQ
jgi:tripartite-type tricarboxylate transporter receptor subunit TctC